MTQHQWHIAATCRLQAAGRPFADATTVTRLLLDDLQSLPFAALRDPDRLLAAGQLAELERGLTALAAGTPLAYVTTKAHFFGRIFRCGPAALVPRPETELLVETVLARLHGRLAARIADLGTGTGCIAVTLALELNLGPGQVVATDLSPAARDLARANAELARANLEVVAGAEGDWASPLWGRPPFDAVVSNPPYIPSVEILDLQAEVRDHEPWLALDGGQDGLSAYRQLAAQCGPLLAAEGFLALELGAGQFPAVTALLADLGWQVEPPVKDLAGWDRVLVAHF